MYRILAASTEVRERRDQLTLTHPAYQKPELLATGPCERGGSTLNSDKRCLKVIDTFRSRNLRSSSSPRFRGNEATPNPSVIFHLAADTLSVRLTIPLSGS